MVVGAVPGTFQKCEEPLYCVGVPAREVGVALGVVDSHVGYEGLHSLVGAVLVGNEYGAIRFHRIPNELEDAFTGEVVGYLGPDVPVSLYNPQNSGLGGATTALNAVVASAPIAFAGFSADIGFVGFHNTLKQPALVGSHGRSDSLLHVPGGLLVEFQVTRKLVA